MNKIRITHDFETQSAADLRKVGAYEYSLHPSTRCMSLAFKASNRNTMYFFDFHQMQKPFKDFPLKFITLWISWIKDPNVIFGAHNSYFETVIYNNVLVQRLGWPTIPIEKRYCTAAKAAAAALPRNLQGAGEALALHTQKDMTAHGALMRICKPTKAWTCWYKDKDKSKWWEEPVQFYTPQTAPQDFKVVYDYNKIDVLSEELLDVTLPDLTPFEQTLWVIDQKINLRGVRVDIPVINKIFQTMASETKTMGRELDTLTMGLVKSGNARAQILDFLALEGLKLPDLKAKTVDDFLANGKASGDAQTLLHLRKALSKASTKKYEAFQRTAASDGRVRDILLFHAASTGRWGGKGVQPQNLPRGIIKDTGEAIERIKTCGVDDLKMLYGANLMPLFSSVLRGMFIASEGCELFVEDWNAIETRVAWWLAGHDEGLALFRESKDPYKEMAAKIFGKPTSEITEDERQVGKAAVLGCFEKNTLVLTSSGWKKIIDVTILDKVWDGVEWVTHEGLAYRGHKKTINLGGMKCTPEHLLLSNQGWVQAQVAQKDFDQFLKSASVLAALPSTVTMPEFAAGSWPFQRNVIVGLNKIQSFCITYFWASLLSAKRVLDHLCTMGKKNTTVMRMQWPTIANASGYLIGYARRLPVAIHQTQNHLQTFKPKLIFWNKKIPVYDLLNCGPRNRFVIATKGGPVVAHNCGYQMGWKKFINAAWDVYRAKVDAQTARKAVAAYREEHWPMPQTWAAYNEAAIKVIENKSERVKTNGVTFYFENDFLCLELPSGRALRYHKPAVRLEEITIPEEIIETKMPDGTIEKRVIPERKFMAKLVRYFAISSKTKKWDLEMTYGGKLTENVVQAVSRDLLAEAIVRAESKGFKVLMHSHDELVSEAPLNKFSVDDYRAIMEALPKWAEGLPLKSSGWKGDRYRK